MAGSQNTSNSSVWMVGVSVAEKLLALGIYIVLARFLDLVDFGVVALCLLILDFITMLITTGVREYIVTRDKVSHTFINTCFISVCSLAAMFGTFLYIVLPYIVPATMENQSLIISILQIVVFLPIVSSINMIQVSMLQRDFAFKQIAINNTMATALSGTLGVYLATQGFGAWSLVAYRYAHVLLYSLLLFIRVKFIPSLTFDVAICKKCYRFSIPLILSEVFNFSSSRVMEIIVSILFGPISFALLDIARKFSKIVNQVSLTALRAVCLSHISNAKQSERGTKHSEFSSNVTFLVTPILILLSVFADGYVTQMFGNQWSNAIPIIEYLGFAALMQALTWYFPLLLIVDNKTKQVFYLNIAFFLLSVFAGLISYSSTFEQYVIVQVIVFNIVAILKIIYLLKQHYITIGNIITFYIPAIISMAIFAVIALLIKNFVFDVIRTDELFDLLIISILSIFTIMFNWLITHLLFNSFSTSIINGIKELRSN